MKSQKGYILSVGRKEKGDRWGGREQGNMEGERTKEKMKTRQKVREMGLRKVGKGFNHRPKRKIIHITLS